MYEDRTQEALQRQAMTALGLREMPQEGTLEDIALRGPAYLAAAVYGNLDRLLAIAFPTRDSGEAVAWRAADFGITRKPGMQAESAGFMLKGTPGAVIPAGTAFVTADGLEFDTVKAVTLGADGTGTCTVRAAQAGARFNVGAGEIARVMVSVTGLSAGSNPNPAEGGMDDESYEVLFDRLDAFRKRPATSGNIAQYEQWAREVDGVGDARAIDVWNGPGTVKVVLVDMEMQPVTESVRQAVAAHIEAMRPAGGVTVTVESAGRVVIDVAVCVKLDPSATLAGVREALSKALREYLLTLTFRASQMVYNRVVYILMGLAGVTDFSELTVCGGTENVPLTDMQVPVLGNVEVTLDVDAS